MRRWYWFLSMMILLGTLCGCASGSNLYAVPRSAVPTELQDVLQESRDGGLELQAPTSGQCRSSVQIMDFNGDGNREAVGFFRDPQNAGLAVQVYTLRESKSLSRGEVMCPGRSFDSVYYADMNRDGKQEMIILTELGPNLAKGLWVLRYDEDGVEVLLSTSCEEMYMVDLNGNGTVELLCISRENGAAVADYYRYGETEITDERLVIDGNYDSIQGIRQGALMDGSAVVLVSVEQGEDELLTEIFTAADGDFVRVELDDPLLHSGSLNGRYLLPEDINGDGYLEIPKTEELPAYGQGAASQYISQWYGIDRFGGNVLQETTYHSLGGGWYFSMPESWLGTTLARENDLAEGNDNISIVTFYRTDADGNPGEEQFAVYTLRGENRQSYAEEQELMILYSDSEQLLAIHFNEKAKTWNGSLTVSQISERFHRITESEED